MREEKKCISYLGKKYAVPKWVKFMATDCTGEVWAFEERPEKELEDGLWYPSNGGKRHKVLGYESFLLIEDWHETLVEVI